MSTAPQPLRQQAQAAAAEDVAAPRRGLIRRAPGRAVIVLSAVCLLAGLIVLSIMVGSTSVPASTAVQALLEHDGSAQHTAVADLRVPRTLLGILCGAALAVAGALMQGMTRNPMADPGLLGVNAGAGFAVTLAVAFLGVTRIEEYLWFSFAGAILAAVAVYAIAAQGRAGATPLRLTLVGLAFGAVLGGISRTLAMMSVSAFDRMRFWEAGTLADRPLGTIGAVLPWILLGVLLALGCARALNGLALGDELARALGVRVGLARAGVVIAVTLLCGASTAAAGPLGFLGLMVPHIVRWVVGPDYRWVLPLCLVAGPSLLLLADVLGRVMVANGELQVGVVTGLIGAPLLVVLAHTRRARPL